MPWKRFAGGRLSADSNGSWKLQHSQCPLLSRVCIHRTHWYEQRIFADGKGGQEYWDRRYPFPRYRWDHLRRPFRCECYPALIKGPRNLFFRWKLAGCRGGTKGAHYVETDVFWFCETPVFRCVCRNAKNRIGKCPEMAKTAKNTIKNTLKWLKIVQKMVSKIVRFLVFSCTTETRLGSKKHKNRRKNG